MNTTQHTGLSILEPGNLPPLISLATAAELLDCSTDTIRRMIARGEIRARRVGKRLLRIESASLLAAAEPVKAAA